MVQLHQRPPLWELRDDKNQLVALQDFLNRERLLIALQPSANRLGTLRNNATLGKQLEDYNLRVLCLNVTSPNFVSHTPRVHSLYDDNGEIARLYDAKIDDETWILVGNDGTIKQIWRDEFSFDAAFRLIDTMPMRQREVRQRKQK